MPTDIQYRDALLLLSNAYFKQGVLDSALISGKELLSFNEKNVEAIVAVSQALVAQKRWAEAYPIVRKGMRASKNNPTLLIQLGRIHFEADSIEQAVVSFSQAKMANPKDIEAFIGLGEAYQKYNAMTVAILQYEEALQLDSSRCDLKYTLAKLYQAEQRYNEAAKMYIATIRCNVDKVQPSLDLGTLYYKAKQYGNAARVLSSYVEVHPENDEIWKQFTESVDASKAYDVGLSVADSILSRDPQNVKALKLSAKCNTLQAKNSHSVEKSKKAIEQYRHLKGIQPLDSEDTKYLGKAHFELKNDSLVILHLEHSLAMDSMQTDIYMDLGSAYMRQKDWGKAALMFQKKFIKDSTTASAYVNYALCQEQLQNWEASRTALVSVLKQVPNYIPGHYHLAYTYQRMDSVQSARKEYETVIALVDTNKTRYRAELGDSYRYLVFVGLFEKNYHAALDAIEKALQFRPKDVELVLWHAQTLHALSRRDEARKEYERVLKLDSKNKDAQKGLDRLDLGF